MPTLTMTPEEAIQVAITRIEKLEARCQVHETVLAAILTIFDNEKLTPEKLLPMIRGLSEQTKIEFPKVSEHLGTIVEMVDRSRNRSLPGTSLKLVPSKQTDLSN